MKQLKYLVLSVLSLWLASCLRLHEEPASWRVEPLPVVYCVLTPGGVTQVFFSATFTGKTPETYPQARAFIVDEAGNETELSRQDSVFVDIEHAVQVKKGKTYRLKIDIGNGSWVKTETTVPNKTAVFSEYSFIPVDTITQFYAYFKSKWTIPPVNNPTNDYRIYTSWGWGIDAVKTSPVDYSAVNDWLIYPPEQDDYTISLFTTDRWLSRFLLNKQYQSYDSSDLISILSSEFTGVLPDFSNIENGVGVFGSYLIHTRDLKGNIVKESE
ncbi:MAG: DUF4249 family protein [Paludibacteraceae bacterium]